MPGALRSPAALAAAPAAPRRRGVKRRPSGWEVEPPRRRLDLAPCSGEPFDASVGTGGQVPCSARLPGLVHRAVDAAAGPPQVPGVAPSCVAVSPADPSWLAELAPRGRRRFDARPHLAAPPVAGRVTGAGSGASLVSCAAVPSGRSRSVRRAPGHARALALPGAFGTGQVHALFCVAASMVCLACGRVFTADAARGPAGVPCTWVPFLPSAALFLLRSEESARLLGALPDGPLRRAAERRGLMIRPREPD